MSASSIDGRRPSGMARSARVRRSPRPRKVSWLAPVFGLVWLVVTVAPLYYLLLSSFRTDDQYLSANPWVPTTKLTLSNYRKALSGGMAAATVNSVIVTTVTACATVGFGFLASYAIVRSRRRWTRSGVFLLFLLGLAVPLEGSIIPLFVLLTREHLYDTLSGLVLPLVAFQLPITVVVITSFLRDVPNELFEAMSLDGASEWRQLFTLAVPLAKPALLGVFIFVALRAWNSFLLPLVLIQSKSLSVVPQMVFRFQTTYATDVPAMLAAVTISAAPLLALYIVGRRHLLRGLTIAVTR